MGAIANEPSMEEILSSIKRIIADEDAAGANGRAPRRRAARPAAVAEDDEDDDGVLELTNAVPPEAVTQDVVQEAAEPAAKPVARVPLRPAAVVSAAAEPDPAPVLSPESAGAARESLSHLTAAVVQREAAHASGQTIDGLVRDMLAPILKEWLDRNLPGMVEQMVQREIDRITANLR